MKEIKSIPSLRFKNFIGNWEISRLNQVSEVIDPHPSHRAPKSEEKGIPFIGIGDISELGEVDYSNVRIVSEEIYEEHYNRYIINKGDVAFGRVASVGKVIELDSCVGKKYTFSPTMAIIKPSKINSSFLKQVLLSNYFLSRVNMKTNGSTRKSIGMNNLRLIEFFIPNKNEQQKIADFLTAVDKRIELLEKKKTLLETYKKGVIKKIFNQEIRFKDDNGNDYPDWLKYRMGEIIDVLSDYTANGSFGGLKENVQYYTELNFAALVRTTDLEKKQFNPQRFTDQRGYDYLSKTSLFGGELIMANVGSIGKIYKCPEYHLPMTLAPNTYMIKFKKDIVDEGFIYQLMKRKTFENKLLSMVGSSTLKAINKKNLRSIEVNIPSKDEQLKLNEFLSSIDNQIDLLETQIDKSKTWKKGLLQKMFV